VKKDQLKLNDIEAAVARAKKFWSERITTYCTRCGRLLIVSEERDGFIYCDYVGEGGLCFDCARKK